MTYVSVPSETSTSGFTTEKWGYKEKNRGTELVWTQQNYLSH